MLLFRNIGVDNENRTSSSFLVPHERPATGDGDFPPSLSEPAHLPRPLTFFQQNLLCLLKRSPIVIYHLREIATNRLVRGPTVKPFSAFVPILNLFVQVADKDGVPGKFQKVGLLMDFFCAR